MSDLDKLIEIVEKTSDIFLSQHKNFILSGVSERSWYTPIAITLTDLIKKNSINGYYVDTEYNRNFDGKLKTVYDDATLIVIPITCDIIVHSRGENINKDNLICIEMKKSNAKIKDKLTDKRRLQLLTKKSFDNVWSADGKCFPEHVCGYELGVYYEIDIKRQKAHLEYYKEGNMITERSIDF